MHQDNEAQLDALLADYAAELASRSVPWPETDDEIDAALDKFQAESVQPAASLPERHRVRLPRSVEPEREDDLGGLRQLPGIVKEAYLHASNGASIDLLVADPERNAAFVQACWSLGAQAPQYDLVRTLLNLRKAGKLGRVRGVRPYRVPRRDLESYAFAVEFSLRLVQDLARFRQDLHLSLDRVLCDPTYGREFVEVAQALSPGLTPLNCRWAALCLRKGMRWDRVSHSKTPPQEAFHDLGSLRDARSPELDQVAGLYWLRHDDRDVYVGSSTDLQAIMGRLRQVPFDRMGRIGGLFETPVTDSSLRLLVHPDATATTRATENARTSLVLQHRPRLNLFAASSRAA